jgi:hypothetical protein
MVFCRFTVGPAGAWAVLMLMLPAAANPTPASTPEKPAAATETTPSALRSNRAMLMLDYQVLRVVGDKPIDLMGFHVLNAVADGFYLGAGLYAPLIKGEYGGFTAYDITAHGRWPLTPKLFAHAGLALGGGAGGRSVEQAKLLSGTGGYYKAYAGLGYDVGGFSLGVNVSKLKFKRSAIDGTQANVFVEVPFQYLTGPFAGHGQSLSRADAAQASGAAAEKMLTVVFDNYKQIKPQASYTGSFSVADMQYAQFVARDTYWYAGLGVGYRGLPLYNHVLGGIGQRLQLSPAFALYGQLGVGSGGYAPERLSTDAGLVVYPRVAAEFAFAKDWGVSLSTGYLVAPKGTSKNLGFGVALTHHIGNGSSKKLSANSESPVFQGYRVSLFRQLDTQVRFLNQDRGQLQMIGVQADAIVGEHVYVPLQASVATNTYLGYPGYGELLAGLGLQTSTAQGQRLQAFGQLMLGTNVHGLGGKASAGVRWGLGDGAALSLAAGHFVARSAAGNRFSANSITLGFDYRFSMPTW